MPQDAFILKIQRELCHPIYARKVSGLSRNRPQQKTMIGLVESGKIMSRAARAARTLVQFFDAVCQMTT